MKVKGESEDVSDRDSESESERGWMWVKGYESEETRERGRM